MKILPGKLAGDLLIQPSKSYLHRMLILAALSGQVVEIKNVNYSDDVNATLSALSMMGFAEHEKEDGRVVIIPGDGRIKGTVDCGESGSTLRFLIAAALTLGREVVFTGRGRLMERPQTVYEELCQRNGFTFEKDGDMLRVCGRLKEGDYSIEGNLSSQFASGLLMALSAVGGRLAITGPVESKGYIDITLEVMEQFGVKVHTYGNTFTVNKGIASPEEVTAQGDWSHAANFLCMGAKYGGITVNGLNTDSNQRDKAAVTILKRMGANITEEADRIRTEPAELKGTNLRGGDIPDIIPALCVVLGVCKGIHKISNVGRLRIKESDRINATCELINSIGGKAVSGDDTITIIGVDNYTGGRVSSFNDHRIAMAAAIASCYSLGLIEVDNGACVKKSAPAFWDEFISLGGRVEE